MSNSPLSNRVLIAEDDIALRSLFARLLTNAGFEVSLATSGPEVMERLQDEILPNILLLDVGLPLISGLKILEHLRSLPAAATMRTIVVTGYPIGERAAEAQLADVLLMKPVSNHDLVTLIKRFMLTCD
jgi:CheY-like chemotaxis protein